MDWVTSLQARALQFPQRSPEWLEHKAKIISSSEVAAALQSNPYETRISLLHRKCSPAASIEVQTTESMIWGEQFEPVAKQIYEQLNGTHIFDVGLIIHQKFNWLGASPDGLLMSKRLIEIKCPKHRKIVKDKIPVYYWIQMQIQMEVCNADACHFFQCSFEQSDKPFENETSFSGQMPDSTKYYRLIKHDDQLVMRDKQWFERILPELEKFWADVQHYRIHGIGKLVADAGKTMLYFDLQTGQMAPDTSESVRSVERQIGQQVSMSPRLQPSNLAIQPIRLEQSSRPDNLEIPELKLNRRITDHLGHVSREGSSVAQIEMKHLEHNPNDPAEFSSWITPTDLQNYLHDDPLIDWLEMYAKGNIHNRIRIPIPNPIFDDVQSFAFAKGAQFEQYVMQAIKRMFPTNVLTIPDDNARKPEYYQQTLQAIKDGYSIIYHGVLHDPGTKTYGVPDLLIKGELLKQLIPTAKIQAHDKYYIVDIKYRGLELCADGTHLLNNPIIVAHKGQVAFYNRMLTKMQGSKSRYAYILGRKWSYESRGEQYKGYGWFERLGHVDLEGKDLFIESRIDDAINWVRRLRSEGSEWQLLPPSIPELYPNMKSDCDARWHKWKVQYAKELCEITSVWYCNVAARRLAHQSAILSYKDPSCTAKALGINGPKIGPTLDSILDVNRKPIGTVLPEFLPEIAKLKRFKVEFFLDFETIQEEADIFISSNTSTVSEQYLVMVGIGYILDGNPASYTYHNLTARRMNQENEKALFINMHTYIGAVLYEYKAFDDFIIYHWANAEVAVYDRLFDYYGESVSSILNYFTFQWFDLCDWFRRNRVVVSGALDFKLKSISAALHLGGHIDSSYSGSQITDGYTAMITMLLEEKRCAELGIDLSMSERMQEVIKYNALDCKVLHEIVEFIYEFYIDCHIEKRNRHEREQEQEPEEIQKAKPRKRMLLELED